jgi:UDP-2-acetamido-3-amino-2,3-dideoxy-glucuronate N-acetyltransferase
MDWRSIADIQLIELPNHARGDGSVVVAEGPIVPFAVARMFTVIAPLGAERGKHAHKLCSQFMMCLHGALDVLCDDGTRQQSFALDRPDLALLVPPTIWNTVTYRTDRAVLAVLCDRRYEAHDYIHDYSEFLATRKASRS